MRNADFQNKYYVLSNMLGENEKFVQNLQGKVQLRDLEVVGRLILKCDVKENGMSPSGKWLFFHIRYSQLMIV